MKYSFLLIKGDKMIEKELNIFVNENGIYQDIAIITMTLISKYRVSTYDLVDGGNLGLKDGDGISDRWLLVGNGGGSEGTGSEVQKVLVLIGSRH